MFNNFGFIGSTILKAAEKERQAQGQIMPLLLKAV